MTAVDAQLLADLQVWYAREARLLDERRFDDWLELLDPEVRYRIPTRYLTLQGKHEDFAQWAVERELGGEDDLVLVDDDLDGLRARIGRLKTGMAWAETPNVEPLDGPTGDLSVLSAVVVFKSRGPDQRSQLSAQRRDALVVTDRGFRLRRRTVIIDDTVLMGENLSMIL